jgi:hypothetical protein
MWRPVQLAFFDWRSFYLSAPIAPDEPVISAAYPASGGVANNANYVIDQSTL